MISKIKLALKGMAMGIAEVIPGVSGGDHRLHHRYI